jgi:hypothetical protein
MSKTAAQPLNVGDSLKITFEKGSQELKPQKIGSDFVPLYVNSNYTCQASLDTINIKEDSLDLKIKLSKKEVPKIAQGENLALNNYISSGAK